MVLLSFKIQDQKSYSLSLILYILYYELISFLVMIIPTQAYICMSGTSTLLYSISLQVCEFAAGTSTYHLNIMYVCMIIFFILGLCMYTGNYKLSIAHFVCFSEAIYLTIFLESHENTATPTLTLVSLYNVNSIISHSYYPRTHLFLHLSPHTHISLLNSLCLLSLPVHFNVSLSLTDTFHLYHRHITVSVPCPALPHNNTTVQSFVATLISHLYSLTHPLSSSQYLGYMITMCSVYSIGKGRNEHNLILVADWVHSCFKKLAYKSLFLKNLNMVMHKPWKTFNSSLGGDKN